MNVEEISCGGISCFISGGNCKQAVLVPLIFYLTFGMLKMLECDINMIMKIIFVIIDDGIKRTCTFNPTRRSESVRIKYGMFQYNL